MALDPSIADLPRGGSTGGEPPEKVMRFASLLGDAWYQLYLDSGADDKAFAVEGTRFRASWAGGCARALSYKVLENDAKVALANYETQMQGAGTDAALDVGLDALWTEAKEAVDAWGPSNPPSVADLFRMGLGTMVHDGLQPAIIAAFPGASIEVAVDLRPEIDGSASVDVVVDEPDRISERTGKPWRTVVEIKSVGGYAFKMAATPERGPAEGPRYGAKVQGALAAMKLDADELVVVDVSLECISVGMASKYKLPTEHHRFSAEWRYDRETIEHLATREHQRVAKVFALLEEGRLAPRAIDDPEIPPAARIVDPAHNAGYGQWTVTKDGDIVATGTTWWCGYCWFRDRCVDDGGPGSVPVSIGR
jgi:hypothetical protein